MIATSQALASAAGLKVLQDGGNAIDAAVTAAGVLAVVEPSMNGIGGDLFAIVYDAKTKRLYGLDSSGRSAHRATPEEFARRGLTEMPGTRPAASRRARRGRRLASAAVALRDDRRSRKALQPAIGYARDGFPVHELMAARMAGERAEAGCRSSGSGAPSCRDGKPPQPGEIFANPRLAALARADRAKGRDAFYKGAIAEAIVADMKSRDGLLECATSPTHTAEWVDADLAPTTAATRCSRCRRARRASSRSRC